MSEPLRLSEQQQRFFEIFGFIVLRGAMRADSAWISDEFDAAWRARDDLKHDGAKTTSWPGVMAMATPRLQTLFDHPVVVGALDSLLGVGWTYYGGDGNFYSGNTNWHSDVGTDTWDAKTLCRHIKVAFYLDPVTADTGALRVIPGSHHRGDRYTTALEHAGLWDPTAQLALRGDQIPCATLSSDPGDIVLFDHRLKHASFGGSRRRRMFCLNVFAHCHDDAQREAALKVLRYYRDQEKVDWNYWIRVAESWSGTRRRHLDQIVDLSRQVLSEVVPAQSA
jgi:hypothetical protein